MRKALRPKAFKGALHERVRERRTGREDVEFNANRGRRYLAEEFMEQGGPAW